MKTVKLVGAILLATAGISLAGCGVDGEPTHPTMSASVGVGSSGTYGSVGVGVRRGGLGVYLGL